MGEKGSGGVQGEGKGEGKTGTAGTAMDEEEI